MLRLVLKLFNLDGADLTSAETIRLQFNSPFAAPIVLLGCLLLVLLVWQVYRREHGVATPRYKAMLASLRIFALAVLVFILLVPTVMIGVSELKESYVVVLADKSDSMKLADRYRDPEQVAQVAYAAALIPRPDAKLVTPELIERVRAMSRADIVNAALANPEFDLVGRLAKTAKVKQFVFDSTVRPAPTTQLPLGSKLTAPPLAVEPDGPVTQIGDSIRDATAELRGQRIAGMIVISDWCSNSGLPPIDATRYALDAKSTFPIFAVGVGDPSEQKDIAMQAISANSVAFQNDAILFNVLIEQSGFDGMVVPLELRLDGQIVATQNITLEKGRKYYTISHTPDKKGEFKYTASVPAREEEMTSANNSAEHVVTVKDDKIRVLLASAAPTWEWRYLKNALARDESIVASVWLQNADADWTMAGGTQLTNFPLNLKELTDGFDVIIFLGTSPEAFSEEQLQNVCKFIGDFGGGLIFEPGALVLNEQFERTPLEKCMPVSLLQPAGFMSRAAETNAFKMRITNEGLAHPAFKLAENAQENFQLWENMASLFWFYPVEKLKPAAQVLAAHPDERTERGPLPLIVEQRYGAGKVMFVASDETWRWRYLVGDRFFYRFWRQSIGSLASNKLLGQSKRVTIAVAKTRYTIGQRVELEAKVLDDMLRPSGQSSLNIKIDLPGGGVQEVSLSPADAQQGVYRGSFVPKRVGDYSAWLRPSEPEKSETAAFSVTMSTLENESRRLDIETMQAVAKKTSGAPFMIYQIGQIPEPIKSESVNIVTERPIEIWDSWGCLLLFALPLCAEWYLRKRRLLV